MSTGAATEFSWSGSAAFLNKERPASEKGTWTNKRSDIHGLLPWLAEGHAISCPIGINITDQPNYPGPADPTQGPYRRNPRGCERQNDNALASALLVFDLDGDATLEVLKATAFAKTKAMAMTTSARHLRVEVDGVLQHRLRLFLVIEGGVVQLFFDNPLYRNPFWLLEEVRAALLTELCSDLGIEKLVDECGSDPARLWYGNTGPSHMVGGKYPNSPAGPLEQIIIGNTIPMAFVEQVFAETEHKHRISEDDDTAVEDLPVGTPQQLQTATHILSNRVLSDERAADYSQWIRLLYAIKKLDPDGDHLLEPFLKFSEQSPHHDACIEDIVSRLDQLPDADEIFIGITAIKEAATEDSPGWEAACPSIGSSTIDPSTRGFITTGMDGPMLVHLRKMYEKAGREMPDYIEAIPKSPAKDRPVSTSRRRRPSSIRSLLRKQPRSNNHRRTSSIELPSHHTDAFNGYDTPTKNSTINDKNSDF